MKCPVCGKENSDNARKCYNCGQELKANEEIENENDGLHERYISQITKESIKEYIETGKIANEKYYQRGILYDMDKTQIDDALKNIEDCIKRFNNFMNSEMEKSLTFSVEVDKVIDKFSDEADELSNECENLNEVLDDESLTYEESDRILKKMTENLEKLKQWDSLYETETLKVLCENYISLHQIKEKENFLVGCVEKYCEPGEFPDISTEIKTQFNGIENKYKVLKEKVKKFEEMVALECNESKDFMYNFEIGVALNDYGIRMGIPGKLASEIMYSYRKRSGVEARVDKEMLDEKEKPVLEKISTLGLPQKTVKVLEQEIQFDSTYFISEYVENKAEIIVEDCAITDEMINSIRKSSGNKFYAIVNILEHFYESSCNAISNLEESLGLSKNKELYEDINDFIEEKIEEITAAGETFQTLDTNLNLEKQYRELRRATRGRWQGGGFGVQGAVKGAIEAGIMNAVSDTAHVAVNSFADGWSDAKNKEEKNKIIREIYSDMPEKSRDALECIANIIIETLEEEYPDCIWTLDREKTTKTLIDLEHEEEKTKYSIELLKLYPFNKDIYLEIMKWIDTQKIKESGLLETAELFGINLVKVVQEEIELHFTRVSISQETVKWLNAYMEIEDEEQEKEKVENQLKSYLEAIERRDRAVYKEQIALITDNAIDSFAIHWKKYLVLSIDEADKMIKESTTDIKKELYIQRLRCLYNYVDAPLRVVITDSLKEYGNSKVEELISKVNLEDCYSLKFIKEKIEKIIDEYGLDKDTYDKFKEVVNKKLNEDILIVKEIEDIEKIENRIITIEKNLGLDLNGWKLEINRKKRIVYDALTDYTWGMQRKSIIYKADEGKEYATIDEVEEKKNCLNKIQDIYYQCKVNDENSITEAVKNIEPLCKESGLGVNILRELESRLKFIDLKERTVLGKEYSTREEAAAERRKVVGNKKYATEAEAENAKEQLRKEQELSESERRELVQIESRESSIIEILRKIKLKNFKSNNAKQREKYYENLILRNYNELKSRNVESRYVAAKVRGTIALIIGIFLTVVGIAPFFSMGWIAKIIIVCIVCYPYGIFVDNRDSWRGLKKDIETKRAIEAVFNIKDGKIYVK